MLLLASLAKTLAIWLMLHAQEWYVVSFRLIICLISL